MFTVSREGGQEPLLMVQTKRLRPVERPLTAEVGELTEVMVPVPDTSDHVPVPTEGVFPAKALVPEQITWSAPAAALVGSAST